MTAPPLPRTLRDDAVRARLDAPEGAWHTQPDLRDSAVLLMLVERSGADHVVYTRRQPHLPAHAGQVCFPGGARERREDAVTCALRETGEELGIARGAVRVVARLRDRISIAGYLVAPFVARLDPAAQLRPNDREVARAFEIPLAAFGERERWSFRDLDTPRAGFHAIPYFDHDGETVWGLTGIITTDFLRAVLEFDPRTPG